MLDQLRHLYDISFPDYERKPFEMVLKGIDQRSMEGYVLSVEGQVTGLAFVILGDSAVVLDYLAVDPHWQNHHLGTEILDALQKIYQKPIIVEIESTYTDADPQKQRRKSFYLRNGFLDTENPILLFDVEMELLSTLRPVSFAEYEHIMQNYFHRDIYQYLKPLPKTSRKVNNMLKHEENV